MNTLLLWDIDCTLIDSGGAGEGGLIRALRADFGIDDPLTWLHFHGRTDRWIARTILEHHALPAADDSVRDFLGAYLAALEPGMANPRARVLPGILEIMDALARRPAIAQGLLTGNLRRGAEIKLRHFDLWRHFPFGAFADDAEDRNALGPVALRRAAALHGRPFTPEHVYVIGDTPHDIACGRTIGARTIAVATGRYSAEALAAENPTAVFADFSQPARLLDLLA